MVRDHMNDLPSFSCPVGYRIRTFRCGEEPLWAAIEAAAGEFPDPEQALQHFNAEFGPYLDAMVHRCFMLETADGAAIGTATAWYGQFEGEERGRVSWVSIIPAYQGRKLSKPLVSAVLAHLAKDHRSAYLTTQTTSYRAVNLYLDFGFVPRLVSDSCRDGWRLMEQVLRRRILLRRV